MKSNNTIGTNNNIRRMILRNRIYNRTVLLIIILVAIIINPSIVVGWNFISLSSSLSSKNRKRSYTVPNVNQQQQQQQQSSTLLSLIPLQQHEMTTTTSTKAVTTRQQFLHKTVLSIIAGTSSYVLSTTPKLCYGQEQEQQQKEEKILVSDDKKALVTLLPILQLQQKFRTIQTKLVVIEKQFSSSPNQQPSISSSIQIQNALRIVQQDIVAIDRALVIINNENDFKTIFNKYSDPISYKQKYINNNAFLVYYTKGFDGIGRPSIENDPSLIKQTIQYSIRNDIWISYNNFNNELLYQCKKETSEDDIDISVLLSYISNAIQSLDTYLTYASPSDVQACIQFLQQQQQQQQQ